MHPDRQLSRRRFLRGAIGGLAAAGIGWRTQWARALVEAGIESTRYFDVVVVGSGAAGLSAALGVLREDAKASVAVLEERPSYGGTSYRSGGRLWIPNNADLRAAGLRDPKDMALKYMARLAHPDVYDPNAPHLGLTTRHHAQLDAYYDNGADMLDYYRSTGIMPWAAERGQTLPGSADPLGFNGQLAPDYHPELDEDVPKCGRAVLPHVFDPTKLTDGRAITLPDYGTDVYGPDLVEWLHYAAQSRGVEFQLGTRVLDLVTNNAGGRRSVTGVRAASTAHGGTFVDEPVPDLTLPLQTIYQARRGVIFAAGGFSKDRKKLEANFSGNRSFTGGGCAVTSATGDLVDLATRHGLLLENMDQAWYIENVYEQYLKDPDSTVTPNYLAFQAYWLNGDSMFVVDRRGRRVCNEKENYHDRGRVHFEPDNRFLVSVFDQHALDYFAGFGGHIIPVPDTWIGPASTTAQLVEQIAARMSRYQATAQFGLASEFRPQLHKTLARFNDFARTGVDRDFHRGESVLDKWWHAFCLTFHGVDANVHGAGIQDCISANTNAEGRPYPNPTLRPLAPPYYAVILSSGLQDTKGGPAIDEHARILDSAGRPVPGLFGAGNCIASPAGAGYWGAGGTLGPATVFGHIAGRHAGRRAP